MASIVYVEVTSTSTQTIASGTLLCVQWLKEHAADFELPEGRFETCPTDFGLEVRIPGLPLAAARRSAEIIAAALRKQPGTTDARLSREAPVIPDKPSDPTKKTKKTLKQPGNKSVTVRTMILLALYANPNIPLSSAELSGLLDKNRQTVDYHLKDLAADGVIECSVRTEPSRPPTNTYQLTQKGLEYGPGFENVPRSRAANRYEADRRRPLRAVLAFLYSRQNAPASAQEVATHLGQVRATANLNLNRLVAIKLIEVAGRRRSGFRGPDPLVYRLTKAGLALAPDFSEIPEPNSSRGSKWKGSTPDHDKLINVLTATDQPLTVAEFAAQADLPPGDVQRMLLDGLAQGLVSEYGADLWNQGSLSSTKYMLSMRGRQQVLAQTV